VALMEYLRHPNGRGKLYGDAEANLATFIDKTSSASGSAKLRDCVLFDAQASSNAQVYGGHYWLSTIGGETVCAGRPTVRNSILICSEVSGRPALNRVHAVGTTEICDNPVLIGTDDDYLVLSNAIIYGNPVIQGAFTVTGRVHEGVWTRPPKHIKLPWCDLSECVNGKMLLDCYCRPVEWWLRFGPRIAKKWDWNQDQIDVTLETIEREFLVSKRAAA
jgi:hypothetical protein